MIHEIRIIFGDTDQMGVVYYANYLRFFESARAAFLRSFGKTHADLDAWDCVMPVVEAHCRYRRPAFYEDLLTVELEVAELRGASMKFEYLVKRGDDLLADGFTRHATISKAGRPKAVPPELRELITLKRLL